VLLEPLNTWEFRDETKKAGEEHRLRFFRLVEVVSDRFDTFRFGAFVAHSFRKCHSLTFVKFFKTNPVEIRKMKEQIFSASCVDKPKSLLSQFLNRTFGHLIKIPKKSLCAKSLNQQNTVFGFARVDSNNLRVQVNGWARQFPEID